MKSQHGTALAIERRRPAQPVEDARQRGRKRLSQIAPGLYELLDTAMEHQADDEMVANDFSVRRPDAAHLFGRRTRKLVRQIQTDVRQLRDEVREIYSLLRRAA